MKNILLLTVLLLATNITFAQTRKTAKAKPAKVHKIIYQLTNGDAEIHKALMRQLGHVLEAAPTAKIEVVCHGPGLDMLVENKTAVKDKIAEFSAKDVKFFACENTLKQKNIDRTAIVTEAGFVPAGIIYIVERQEQGWSYIKAGN